MITLNIVGTFWVNWVVFQIDSVVDVCGEFAAFLLPCQGRNPLSVKGRHFAPFLGVDRNVAMRVKV